VPDPGSGSPGWHKEELEAPPPARRNRSWYWLLIVPTVAPLLTPLYNRTGPRLFGMPFFYWFQIAWIVVGAGAVALAYALSAER